MSEVAVVPKYWTMLEALKQTANPMDWERLLSQLGLHWFGLGPTTESDQLYHASTIESAAQPASILPGKLTYVPNLARDRGGVRQDLEALRRAASPLRRALISEVLQATGIPFGKNERVNILSDLWRGFILDFEASSVKDNGGRRFDGVRITHAEVAAAEVPREVQSTDLLTASAADSQNSPSLPDKMLKEETRLKLKAIVAFHQKGGRSKGMYRNISSPMGSVLPETEFAYRIMIEVRPDLKSQHNAWVAKSRSAKADLENVYRSNRAPPRDAVTKLQPRKLETGFSAVTIKKLVLDLENDKHPWLIRGDNFKQLLNSPGDAPPDIDNEPCE
jgi:hypothetical protein